MSATLRGKLLVATPALTDPNFDRTVVLLLEHGADAGALGVVLNRPTATTLHEALPDWADFAAAPAVVYLGGPVALGTIIALALTPVGDPSHEPPEGVQRVADRLATIDLAIDPAAVVGSIDGLRVWSGYAGWAPGQLEGEIDAGGWFVVDADPTDVATSDPEHLWRDVLARQPGALGWFGNFPDDPTQN